MTENSTAAVYMGRAHKKICLGHIFFWKFRVFLNKKTIVVWVLKMAGSHCGPWQYTASHPKPAKMVRTNATNGKSKKMQKPSFTKKWLFCIFILKQRRMIGKKLVTWRPLTGTYTYTKALCGNLKPSSPESEDDWWDEVNRHRSWWVGFSPQSAYFCCHYPGR